MSAKKFECGLGFHEYTMPHRYPNILTCKHCKRFGYFKSSTGLECWYEFDDNGNEIHYKDNKGYETWHEYDKDGNEVHFKNNNGCEEWLSNKGNWVEIKPVNWEYENELQKI